MKRFDVKSVLLGLAAGVLVSFCLGAAAVQPRGPVGRFQMTGTESDAFVIDTTTGKVWHGYYQPAMMRSTDQGFLEPKLGAE